VAYNALAEYAEEIGDYDTALNATNSAIAVDDGLSAPVRAQTYVQAGMLLARINKSDEATRRFRQAYGLNPQNMIAIEQLKVRGVPIDATTALPPGL
jgi:tetratricopeptide (TPR) repeat protein